MVVEEKSEGDRVRDLLSGAKTEATVIAPFIKIGALQSLLDVIPVRVKVRCVTRWLPKDIAAGVSDPEIIELLERRGHFSISLVDTLHAKLYISDGRCLAGSANVTGAALGGAGDQSNIEILVETTIDDPSVSATLEAISQNERQATQIDAEIARRLADSLALTHEQASKEAFVWFPRSRKPEHAYELYRKPPTGYLSNVNKILLGDVASANIQPGLGEREFRLAIRTLLARIPLAEQLLCDTEDLMLTKSEALPYIAPMAGPLFTTQDLWQAFANWMANYYADVVMKQEITETALRRAQILRP